jgi:hypothetical protein
MAFIVIDGDTSWQDLAIAEELATSYNRRRLVFGLSTIAAPTQASQVFTFIQTLQDGIEEMIGYNYFGLGTYYGWMLNTSALSSYTGVTSLRSLTLSQGMDAAGLTESGYWRRIPEGGTQPANWINYSEAGWSYGKITDKDLAGPWLFIDLQNAMSALTRVYLRRTQQRQKHGYYGGPGPIASTAMSWGSWGTGTAGSEYLVSKTKTGSSITSASTDIYVSEYRFDIDASLDSLEAGRICITMPYDGNPSYAAKAGKMSYANLGVADVSTVLGKTVSNTTSKSISGATLSYYAIEAEDESNILPVANDVLPDANVPSNSTVVANLDFSLSGLIIDFNFE